MTATVQRIEPLTSPPDATIMVPGSKSITNRALVCAGLATGRSELRGIGRADDTDAMIAGISALGAQVAVDGTDASVSGTSGRGPGRAVVLDARLSGTTARFLAPVAALGADPVRIDGGAPLRARPMDDIVSALEAMGAGLETAPGGHLPLTVRGPLRGGEVTIAAATSSQFASGLLLAAPCLAEGLTVRLAGQGVSRPYLDLTVDVMTAFGARVEVPDPLTFHVAPGGYAGVEFRIEPDASAASYFFAAAAITGGRVRIEGLGSASLQGDLQFVHVLEEMGAAVRMTEQSTEVEGTGHLRGVRVDLRDFSDTAQTVAAVAVFADGPTTIDGIGFIRRKETDRIGSVATELRRIGIDVDVEADGMTIHPGTPQPGRIETYDDHRMAMSFAVIGLRAAGIEIADPGCVSKTFPNFWDTLDQLRAE